MAVWEVLDNEIRLIEVTYAGTHEKDPIGLVDIRIIGPIADRARAIDAPMDLGFMDPTDSVPRREVFSGYREDQFTVVALPGAQMV